MKRAGECHYGICEEGGRVLVIADDFVGWFQINDLQPDYRGREKKSTTSKIYHFKDIYCIEEKTFHTEEKSDKLVLKLHIKKKEIITFALIDSRSKVVNDICKRYFSFKSR